MVRPLADHDQSPDRPKFNFRRVGAKSSLRGSPTGGPAKGKVLPTGRCTFTVGATGMYDAAAVEKGLDPRTCSVSLGVEEEVGVVGVSPVPSGTLGSKDPRRNEKRRTMTVHLASVFKDSPLLRPTTIRECTVTEGLDENDEPCVVLALSSSLAKPAGTGPKKAGTESKPAKAEDKQPAAGEAEAKPDKTEPAGNGD